MNLSKNKIDIITPEEINLDGYDLRYQFAKTLDKSFRLVSDALDVYGFNKFEELYQQSLN